MTKKTQKTLVTTRSKKTPTQTKTKAIEKAQQKSQTRRRPNTYASPIPRAGRAHQQEPKTVEVPYASAEAKLNKKGLT